VRSAWFAAGRCEDGGFFLPGRPRHESADLVLRQDHVRLVVPTSELRLAWNDLDERWHVSIPVAGSRGGAVQITFTGLLVTESAGLREAATGRLDRVLSSLDDTEPYVPLRRSHFGRIDGEAGTLAALCKVLVARPETREHLADPDRMKRLARDMGRSPLPRLVMAMGACRTTTEILTQMRGLGYYHRIDGRPMPDEELPTAEEIASGVERRLATNPYVKGLHIAHGQIVDAARKHYLDVARWPFYALVT
jgi:hypothetical protein